MALDVRVLEIVQRVGATPALWDDVIDVTTAGDQLAADAAGTPVPGNHC